MYPKLWASDYNTMRRRIGVSSVIIAFLIMLLLLCSFVTQCYSSRVECFPQNFSYSFYALLQYFRRRWTRKNDAKRATNAITLKHNWLRRKPCHRPLAFSRCLYPLSTWGAQETRNVAQSVLGARTARCWRHCSHEMTYAFNKSPIKVTTIKSTFGNAFVSRHKPRTLRRR